MTEAVSTPLHEYQYDVALSFAGEDRAFVESVARHLVDCEVRVFYDEFYKADLWGKDLFQHLASIYRDKAKFCIVFVSRAYKEKVWPKHELRQAQERALFSSSEYILPVIIDDDVDLPGLNKTTGYLDARITHPWTISGLVLRKLGAFDHKSYDRSEVARLKNLKKVRGRKVKFAGMEMAHYWPPQIRNAQVLRHVSYAATVRRIPYGYEMAPRYRMKANCYNCGVRRGQVHVPGCTAERCPLCSGQLVSCQCPIDDYTSVPFEAKLIEGKDDASMPPPEPYVPDRYDSAVETSRRHGMKVRRR